MNETLNAAALHNNGAAELTIGIRGKQFKLILDDKNGKVTLLNPKTQKKLSLDVEYILTSDSGNYAKYAFEDGYTPVEGAVIALNSDSTISPAKLTVTDIANAIASIANKANTSSTLAGYGIKNAYTKDEVDLMLDGMLYYIGAYASYSTLTDAIADGTLIPKRGMVAYIVTAGGKDVAGVQIHAYSHIFYDGTGWQVM